MRTGTRSTRNKLMACKRFVSIPLSLSNLYAPKHTHSRLAEFHPTAWVKGPLGSVPMVIRCYVSEYASISRLVPYLCLDPLLLHFHPLCLHISCRLPPSLQVNTHLFQSSPYNLHSQSLIRLQTQLQHRTIHNVLNYGIMAEDDVRLHLLQSCFRH